MSAGEKNKNEAPLAPGLYIVATPIGNLEDITLRALRMLKQVDVIACEDTRQTQKLLNHYGIAGRTTSYHEHNEITRSAELVLEMEQGASVALVTDAGTPGISDPGFRLVALAVRHHIPVVPIPGPVAFATALVASGLASDSFEFHGFLPAKSGQRRQSFEDIKESKRTEIFYETPHRIKEAIEDLVAILGSERPIVVARELTKLHEEFLRGTAAQVFTALQEREEIRGEITLLIGAFSGTPAAARPVDIATRVRQVAQEDGSDENTALKKVAKELGIGKSEAYRELQRVKAGERSGKR
jgi:16S rRNA (cytidine1402-2'-O)-methyltransferase